MDKRYLLDDGTVDLLPNHLIIIPSLY